MTPEHPLVSIIIPTYNRAALLRETIESVLAQTYAPIELIVVDDGSTDDTPDLLASYGSRLRAIRTSNGGGTAARNTGIRAAQGELIAVLDHDDLLLPDKIARQVALLRERPACGVAYCGYTRIDRHGTPMDSIRNLPDGDILAQLVLGCFIWSGAPLIRRECLEQVGLFDVDIWSSDADMWLRLALAGYHFGCISEPLGCYRILPDSSMADVERTERMDMVILERVAAHPGLTEAARANLSAGLFNQRFWLSTRYYAVGRYEDARRNLLLALELRPDLFNAPSHGLLQLWCASAVDPRVEDSCSYTDALLRELPPAIAQTIAPHADELRAWVAFSSAIRQAAYGDHKQVPALLLEAHRRFPALLADAGAFMRTVAAYALHQTAPPTAYIDRLLALIPPELAHLRRSRRELQSAVSVAQAFDGYARGQHRYVPRHIIRAVAMRPALLGNRGVVSIFVRSLAATAVPR